MNGPEEVPMTFTRREQKVLSAMKANAEKETSGDFGMLETLKVPGIRGKELGGVITSLQKKGAVTVHEPVETNGGPREGGERWTQFTFPEEPVVVDAALPFPYLQSIVKGVPKIVVPESTKRTRNLFPRR